MYKIADYTGKIVLARIAAEIKIRRWDQSHSEIAGINLNEYPIKLLLGNEILPKLSILYNFK